MVVFPNAKINLGLHVTGQRKDGFHDIESLMYPVTLCDILEIIPSGSGTIEFRSTGLPVPGTMTDNLCIKAFNLLASTFPLPAVKIHLHKVIPMGSGLGGGSSDAAFTLKILNELFSIGLSPVQLMEFSGKLGSDCPFFIENRPGLATGRGDLLQPVSPDIAGYSCIIVVPDVHVSTAEAYAGVTVKKPAEPIPGIVTRSPESWKDHLVNDFEQTVIRRYPVIGGIKEELYSAGAVYVSMSGSGSAVYGVFCGEAPDRNRFPGFFTWTGWL